MAEAKRVKVLLAGESWVSAANHYKGFDQFGSVTFHTGVEPLVRALKDSRFDLTYMPSHEAAEGFPFDLAALAQYDVVILSDIGANTLLLPPAVWLTGKPQPNRLKILREWTQQGGGLMMIGGYFSFQGIDGRARWRGTPVEAALPVTCLPYDDRVEVPEGFRAEVTGPADHPVLVGLGTDWPLLLGANEVVVKGDADVQVLARLPPEAGGHPLLVTGHHGKGRSIAWTSDIGPHWVPTEFTEWAGFGQLWRNAIGWLADGG